MASKSQIERAKKAHTTVTQIRKEGQAQKPNSQAKKTKKS